MFTGNRLHVWCDAAVQCVLSRLPPVTLLWFQSDVVRKHAAVSSCKYEMTVSGLLCSKCDAVPFKPLKYHICMLVWLCRLNDLCFFFQLMFRDTLLDLYEVCVVYSSVTRRRINITFSLEKQESPVFLVWKQILKGIFAVFFIEFNKARLTLKEQFSHLLLPPCWWKVRFHSPQKHFWSFS